MAILTRTEYNDSIQLYIIDNTDRLISEQDVRDRFIEAKDSYLSTVSGFDIPEYSAITIYQIGDCVTYESLLYRKVNSASSGQLPTNPLHWELLPDTPFATESKWGIVRKATIVEFEDGTDDEKYVTPFQIASLSIPDTLDDLLDVDYPSPPTQGQGIFYDEGLGVFQPEDLLTVPASDYLQYDALTRTLTFDDTSIPSFLNDLNDVTLGTVSNGQALVYDSGTNQWTNQNVASDNIYISDGSLTGNRTVSGAGHSLSVSGTTSFNVDSDYIGFTIRDNTVDGLVIDDQRATTNGAQYASDYISGYTDRTLTDWGNVKARIALLLGISANDVDLGTFTGDVLSDNISVKSALQEFEDAITFTAGSVIFAGSNGVIDEDNPFFHYIQTTKNLGIGGIPTTDGVNTLSLWNGTPPSVGTADSTAFYTKDFPLASNSSSPYAITEDNREISMREAWITKESFQFHTDIDTVVYKTFSGPVSFVEELYSADQIDSFIYAYRAVAPAGHGNPFIIPASGTLSDLNAVSTTFLPNQVWDLQITAVFDPLWFGLASLVLKYEPELSR